MVEVEENRLSKTLSQINVIVKVDDVKDQEALRVLLKTGKAFNPMEGYVASVYPVSQTQSETAKQTTPAEDLAAAQAEGWEQKVSHGGKGEPYEFMPYAKVSGRYVEILGECRQKGFGRGVDDPDGFSYRIIAGGLMRRKTHVTSQREDQAGAKTPKRRRQAQPKPASPKGRRSRKEIVAKVVD